MITYIKPNTKDFLVGSLQASFDPEEMRKLNKGPVQLMDFSTQATVQESDLLLTLSHLRKQMHYYAQFKPTEVWQGAQGYYNSSMPIVLDLKDYVNTAAIVFWKFMRQMPLYKGRHDEPRPRTMLYAYEYETTRAKYARDSKGKYKLVRNPSIRMRIYAFSKSNVHYFVQNQKSFKVVLKG